jgi:hypothetical protein
MAEAVLHVHDEQRPVFHVPTSVAIHGNRARPGVNTPATAPRERGVRRMEHARQLDRIRVAAVSVKQAQ